LYYYLKQKNILIDNEKYAKYMIIIFYNYLLNTSKNIVLIYNVILAEYCNFNDINDNDNDNKIGYYRNIFAKLSEYKIGMLISGDFIKDTENDFGLIYNINGIYIDIIYVKNHNIQKINIDINNNKIIEKIKNKKIMIFKFNDFPYYNLMSYHIKYFSNFFINKKYENINEQYSINKLQYTNDSFVNNNIINLNKYIHLLWYFYAYTNKYKCEEHCDIDLDNLLIKFCNDNVFTDSKNINNKNINKFNICNKDNINKKDYIQFIKLIDNVYVNSSIDLIYFIYNISIYYTYLYTYEKL